MAGMWVRVPETFWCEVEPLLPVPERRFRYPGRKRYPERACLEGILTVLRWGIPWRELPQAPGRPSGKTCWRRFDQWQRAGVWAQLVAQLQGRLAAEGKLDWQRALLDSTIVDAKKGATIGKSPVNRGRPSTKLHLSVRPRRPLALVLGREPARPCARARRRRRGALFAAARRGRENRPSVLLADRGYDADCSARRCASAASDR